MHLSRVLYSEHPMQTNAKYALISGICLSTVLCTLKAPLKYNCKAKGDPLWNRKKFFFSSRDAFIGDVP